MARTVGGIAALLVVGRGADGQVSPGPLAAPHARLEGPRNCTKCHAGGGITMDARCLSCHSEIAWARTTRRGLHGREARGTCASCHPDHAGQAFALVSWPDGSPETFNHATAGYVLEGRHAAAPCVKCHVASLQTSPAVRLSPREGGPKWGGLETACGSCHTDVHAGTLGATCTDCHEPVGWRALGRFDHARTRYTLTGKHRDVECSGCHTGSKRRGATTAASSVAVTFAPLASGDCASCHRDPHGGRLRGSCGSCHVTSGFAEISERKFSHDQTRFALKGRHANVACAACHVGYPGRVSQPAFTSCGSCHTDAHRGEATIAGAPVDCGACHTVAGFATSTFTVAQHERTRYPLTGGHAAAPCSGCHRPGTTAGRVPARNASSARTIADGVTLRPVADRCESCHASAHGDALTNVRDATCRACHTTAAWSPNSFSVRDHARARLPLEGRHAEIACARCHGTIRPGLGSLPATALGRARVAFALPEVTCGACHRDPHAGRYAAAPGGCAACHDARAFRPSLLNADRHATFAFPLEGAHRAVACATCHAAMRMPALGAHLVGATADTVRRSYTGIGTACASCHGSPHGDQFSRRPRGDSCMACHDAGAWAPASRFDHAADGGFVLGAAHEKVACVRCHRSAEGTAGVRQWRGVSRTCESCHGSKRRGVS